MRGPFSVALTLTLTASACGGSSPPAASPSPTPTPATASSAPTAVAAKIPQLVVTASEYAYEGLPAQIEAGLIDITLRNAGAQDHEVLFARLKQGSYETFKTDLPKGLNVVGPAMLEAAGAPDRASPGDKLRAILDLAIGDYVVYSSVAVAGVPEVIAKSMHRPLRVVAPTALTPPEPAADARLDLKDGAAPELKGTLAAGSRTVIVVSSGARVNSATIVRLATGKTVADFSAWLKDRQGQAPFVRVGGVVGLSAGKRGWALLDLVPGEYVIYNLQAAQLASFTLK